MGFDSNFLYEDLDKNLKKKKNGEFKLRLNLLFEKKIKLLIHILIMNKKT